jgi:regulator of nonsense transcripts 1
MDTFDNFQYDSASSYGGMGVVDDNSSVYTANTQDNTAESIDLSNLSISNFSAHSPTSSANGHGAHHRNRDHNTGRAGVEEDFDAVLDDLKDEGAVDLPPHACRYVNSALFLLLASRYKWLPHTM